MYSTVKSKSTTTRNVMNLLISCVEYFMKIENDDEDHNHDTTWDGEKKRIPRGKPHGKKTLAIMLLGGICP